MTAPNAVTLPNYSAITTIALEAPNFAAVRVGATQAIMAAWSNPTTPVPVLQWLVTYANNETKIDEALKTYLGFLVASPALLKYQGAFINATLPELSQAVIDLLTAFVLAAAKAQGAK